MALDLARRPLLRAVLAATAAALSSTAASPGGPDAPSCSVPPVPPAVLSGLDLPSVALRPIRLSSDPITGAAGADVGPAASGSDVVAAQTRAGGGAGSLAFVVRRPG